jgi:hypothetical protein
MRNLKSILVLSIFIITSLNCKEVYNPPSVKNNPSPLLADGIIFSGNDSSKITLSRTKSLSDTAPQVKEVNARRRPDFCGRQIGCYYGKCILRYDIPELISTHFQPLGGPYGNSLISQGLDTVKTSPGPVYYYSTNLCVECTYNGGITVNPSYWP